MSNQKVADMEKDNKDLKRYLKNYIELKDNIVRQRDEADDDKWKLYKEIQKLREELKIMTDDRDKLITINHELDERIDELEYEVLDLKEDLESYQ